MSHTAESIIKSSPKFVEMATEGALQLIAENNGQSYKLAEEALKLEVPNVVNQVTDLVWKTAEELANKLNNETA